MNLISEQPLYFLLLCPVAGWIYAWLLYRNEKQKGHFSHSLLRLLAVLRFIAVTIITSLLLQLMLKREVNETEKPLLLFAFDNSTSVISANDSSEIKTNFIPALDALQKNLSDKYRIQTLLFGNKVSHGRLPDFTDNETDFSELLNEVNNNFSNSNIGALIISSDGIINRGNAHPAGMMDFNFPVYALALGDTTLKKDVLLKKINHNQVVYLGNKFPVEIVIQAIKLKGKATTVSIYKNGVKKSEQPVTINNDNFIQTFDFILEADQPGVQKYRAVINHLPEEMNPVNNSQDFIVEVIDTREKILLLAEAPHPDVAAIKESIESGQTYEVETALASSFSRPLKPYSLLILHGLQLTNSSLMNEMNKNQQACLILHPKANENLPGLTISTAYNKQNETEPVYNKNFTLFNISDGLKNYLKEFPAVKTIFGKYTASSGANILAYQKIGMVETENPLVLLNDNGGRKTGIIACEGIWKWKLRDYSDHGNHDLFNEFILKCVQYLSVKADKSFFRVSGKKIISENDPVELNAEVYNPSYQLITEPDVSVLLTDSAGKQFNFTMSKTGNAYYLNAGLFPPGEYHYKATVKTNNRVFVQNGTITVKAIVAEKTNTVANHALLHELAGRNGGKLFYKNELEKLKQELINNETIKPITYSQKHLSDLIDLKWIFFIIAGLLSIEWFLRKRGGSI